MAVLAMEKVQVLGMKSDLQKVLAVLQEKGVMQVQEVSGDHKLDAIDAEDHQLDFEIAQIDYAIKQLKDHATKRPIWQGMPVMSADAALKAFKSFDQADFIEKLQIVEEQLLAIQNKRNARTQEMKTLMDWKALSFPLDTEKETKTVRIIMGAIPGNDYDEFKSELAQIGDLSTVQKVSEKESNVLCVLVIAKSQMDQAKRLFTTYKLTEVTLPVHAMTVSERIHAIEAELKSLATDLEKKEAEFKGFAKHVEDLQIVHDVLIWQREESTSKQHLKGSQYSFVIEGWIPKKSKKALMSALEIVSSSIAIEKIDANEGEQAPTLLQNSPAWWPFESITKLYGFPSQGEVDPTPFLATFFILFFALCLTDFGYGLSLFVIMGLALKFLQLPVEVKRLTKLLMWGGILTMIAGVVFGGYFGMTPEQAPAFMTNGDGFRFQLLNPMVGSGPLTFLAISIILGVVHLFFGKLIHAVWMLKQGDYASAFFDGFLWHISIGSVLVFGLSKTGVLSETLSAPFMWTAIAGFTLMLFTLGRAQESIVGKLGSGAMDLYLTISGFLSDVLSYSRIMALGMATGVIAFTMNTIAGLMLELIPYVGFVFAGLVLVFGHIMNLVLSALGAFIHSARLQFVEFFGKFMEGGGAEFKPLRRQCKYILIK
jgi:V/A-type H+-transporting ATPase subunit I